MRREAESREVLARKAALYSARNYVHLLGLRQTERQTEIRANITVLWSALVTVAGWASRVVGYYYTSRTFVGKLGVAVRS